MKPSQRLVLIILKEMGTTFVAETNLISCDGDLMHDTTGFVMFTVIHYHLSFLNVTVIKGLSPVLTSFTHLHLLCEMKNPRVEKKQRKGFFIAVDLTK